MAFPQQADISIRAENSEKMSSHTFDFRLHRESLKIIREKIKYKKKFGLVTFSNWRRFRTGVS